LSNLSLNPHGKGSFRIGIDRHLFVLTFAYEHNYFLAVDYLLIELLDLAVLQLCYDLADENLIKLRCLSPRGPEMSA